MAHQAGDDRGRGAEARHRRLRLRHRGRLSAVHRVPPRHPVRQGLGLLRPRAHLLGQDGPLRRHGQLLPLQHHQDRPDGGEEGPGRRKLIAHR